MNAHASRLIGPLLRYAHEREYMPNLQRYGLCPDALARDETAIGEQALGQLLADLAVALDEPHLGLILPSKLRFERYTLAELAARASPTLREALQQWTRFSQSVHASTELAFTEQGAVARWSYRTIGHPRGLSRHMNELVLAATVHATRETSAAGLRLLEVHFVHARPRTLGLVRQFFDCDVVHFGAPANQLVIDARSLDQPQLTADARLLATVNALGGHSLAVVHAAGKETVSARVAELVRAQLADGEVRIRPLARSLHMSVRTLQRRLGEEGTSFATLVDAVRGELARQLLRQAELSLVEVAARVGFGELATFSRAFKRWTGVAPGAFRNAQSDT